MASRARAARKGKPLAGVIWVDITELFDHFRFASHPTGVSRVVLSLADALALDPGNLFQTIRPLLWHPVYRRPTTIDPTRLLPLAQFFPGLKSRYAAAGLSNRSSQHAVMKAIRTSLPRPLRFRMFPADSGVSQFARWAARQGLKLSPASFSPGDCLFAPGSFWLGGYAGRLTRQAQAAGIPVVAFVHDVLLLSHPEWLPGRHSQQFRRGCDSFLPACAALACNSAYTRDEIRRNVPPAAKLPIHVCRLADKAAVASGSLPAEITPLLSRRYALCVSTVTPRKNHELILEAWFRLGKKFGDATPYLVLVGGGHPDPRLREMMEREKKCGNRVVWLRDIDDVGLEALYRQAWITIYPSLAEGYGMPVAEALSRGKVCLAGLSTGIREVAMELIDAIDPTDSESVVTRLHGYISDPTRLAAREAEIKRCYRPTDWSSTARCIRSVLEQVVRER
jgi:glycosyltransferase involved in cell wall biosynthesis